MQVHSQLRPRPHVSGYFWKHIFLHSYLEIFASTRRAFQKYPRPHENPVIFEIRKQSSKMPYWNIGKLIAILLEYDTPSVPLLKELGWLSIKEMIPKEISTMMYKPLNDLTPQYLSGLFDSLSDFHTRELRNTKNDLAVPLMRTVSGQKAFSYRGTKVWNKFNNSVKEAPSVYSFN